MYDYVDIAYREPVQLIYVTPNSSNQSAISLGTTCGFHKSVSIILLRRWNTKIIKCKKMWSKWRYNIWNRKTNRLFNHAWVKATMFTNLDLFIHESWQEAISETGEGLVYILLSGTEKTEIWNESFKKRYGQDEKGCIL